MARQKWGSRWAFVLAAIGSAAGLGNAWRFPYMAYSNGGGAFYVPYFIALFLAGIPLLMAEFAIGQGFQSGAPRSLAKIKKGAEFIGWWAVITGALITFYYNVIMAYIFNYLYYSFGVAWKGDPNKFFFNEFLQVSNGPSELGSIRWPIVIGLALTWLWIYFILRKGTTSVGKTVAWTVPLPVILLIILGIRGITLEGAAQGLNFLFQPNFAKLAEPRVWANAFGQIFFTLSLAFGIMIAYGSYNKKEEDIANNAIITALGNSATSFLAGIAVFSVLGYMALQINSPIDEVVSGGIGLAFVVYPQAISLFPGGVIVQSIIGLAFFVMLLTLGIDSAFSLVEAVEAAASDKFKFNKRSFLIGFSIFGFLVGLLYSTQGGLYWLDIIDHFLSIYALLIVGILESIIIGWVLDAEKLRNYINKVSEVKIGKWFDISLRYIIPGSLIIILGLTLYDEIKNPYGGYPTWALLTGFAVLIATPIIAIILSKVPPKDNDYYKKEEM
ncbi:transporter [Thermosipho melanesiensis]|uniref:Transporter n=2 Tax=Thermosipho melanesiensis TaxID=46541 RepID=A6LMJ8_THEM4|nr:sodium-dependent transporter [Thermosipho melanesiensis]ABR31149.1 sodium:neurotransmitter symporter [Thermosipho melanesiensis BI429]APT74239.1 transporter [Thermosipho melanesiensis]OOC36180.1 transporter [Thermosipho melanesiensis]OOC36998.1 transporter [Thermosipho melanesiensis]OOC37750.1 transporter [Thermosipho melanesiensis]